MASGVKELEGRVGCRDMVMFDPWKIEVEKDFNPRSKEGLRANIDRLKPMIEAAQGVLEPLWVRRDGERCTLIGGESRLYATRELLKEGRLPKYQGKDADGNPKPFGVPVLHREGANEEAERISLALLENSGAPLEKWELGKSYARLVNAGWEVDEIAKRQGKTTQFVEACITLNDGPDDLKKMLIMGEVSEGKAVQVIKKHGSKAAEVIATAPRNAKGKVVREKKSPAADLKALVVKMFDTFTEEEIASLSDTAEEFISVDRKKLLALYRAVK